VTANEQFNSKGQMPNVYGYIPGYCTLFACYCLVHIGEGHQVPFSTLNSKKAGYWWHAPSLMKYYKRQGKLVTDVKKAKPGAIAFKGSKSPTHTCIFVKYEKGYVYTWDGNVGGGVTYNKRKASVFCGFANLKYKDYFGKGTSGTDVLKWQKFLNWYFDKRVVAEDSVFSDATVKYTKEFQTAVGVTADGTVGMDTWKKAKAVQK
jgi:peptidoglycan hydrolase-like protein with peptidoglycan-binding domain